MSFLRIPVIKSGEKTQSIDIISYVVAKPKNLQYQTWIVFKNDAAVGTYFACNCFQKMEKCEESFILI